MKYFFVHFADKTIPLTEKGFAMSVNACNLALRNESKKLKK